MPLAVCHYIFEYNTFHTQLIASTLSYNYRALTVSNIQVYVDDFGKKLVNFQDGTVMVVRHLHKFSLSLGPVGVVIHEIVLHIYIYGLICSNGTL